VEKNDVFKALTNNLISGRLMHMDFEVTLDSLDKVLKTPGIGQSSVNKMAQFLKRGDGKCDKIEAFEQDEHRMAMRTFKRIWGVGKAMVSRALSCHFQELVEILPFSHANETRLPFSSRRRLCTSMAIERSSRYEMI